MYLMTYTQIDEIGMVFIKQCFKRSETEMKQFVYDYVCSLKYLNGH